MTAEYAPQKTPSNEGWQSYDAIMGNPNADTIAEQHLVDFGRITDQRIKAGELAEDLSNVDPTIKEVASTALRRYEESQNNTQEIAEAQ